MSKIRGWLIIATLMLIFGVANASTVVVYPTYTNTVIGKLTHVLTSRPTFVDMYGNKIFALNYDKERGILKLVTKDVITGDIKEVTVDSFKDLVVLGGVVANDGYVTVGYTRLPAELVPEPQTLDGYFKIYTTDLQPVGGKKTCTVERSIQDETQETPTEIYVVCGEDVERNGIGNVSFVRVYPFNDNGTEKFLVIVGVVIYQYDAPDYYPTLYTGIGVLENPNGKVVIRVTTKSGGMNRTLIPITGMIVKGETPKAVIYGQLELDWSSGEEEYYVMVGPVQKYIITDPNTGLQYTNYDVTAFHYTERLPRNNVLITDTQMVRYKGRDLLIVKKMDGTIVITDGSNDYLNLSDALSELGLIPLSGDILEENDYLPNRASLSVYDDEILLVEMPVLDQAASKNKLVLLAYHPDDGKLRRLRDLSIYNNEHIDGSLYGTGKALALIGRDDSNDTGITYKLFDELWILADPPYLQEPPGSTFTATIHATVPVDLVDQNIPPYMTVNLPTHIDPPGAEVTISISNDAPENEYGIIKFTYAHTGEDGIVDRFESGIIYKTAQANDPPTMPEINSITAEGGFITVTWTPSTDPDNDPITYIIEVYDETEDQNVLSDTTADTTYTFPGVVGHVYQISLTATDGNLYSDTYTEEFLYEWKTSLRITDPVDGTYTIQNLPLRIKYYTNADATLEIRTSTDGLTWNVIESASVSGKGVYDTNITVNEGTTYIMAVLILNSEERQSNVVTVTFSPSIGYTLMITEPADGSTYQTKPDSTVNVPFSAYYEVPTEGVKKYYILVSGDDLNEPVTVAAITTEENTYTLTGSYGLGKGDYIAYPAVETDSGTVYGQTISFKVEESNAPNNPPSTPILYDIGDTAEINVTLYWHPSTDPEGDPITYSVVVARDETFQDVVFSGTTTDTSIEVNNLYGGHVYYWRVQACDDKGLCSAWSTPDSFAVYESSGVEIVYPTNGSSFVADETNVVDITVKLTAFSNTDKDYIVRLFSNDTQVFETNYTGPMDETVNVPLTLSPGNYTLRAELVEADTNYAYPYEVNITVYAHGQEEAPAINLIDPQDGYVDTVTDLQPKTTITTRAEFDLIKDGEHTIAIQYKLRWARTWSTIIEDNVVADTNSGNTHFTLTANVELGEGIYLFRAVVVDPDNTTWTSETHTVYIQKQTTTPPGGGEGGAGGGGAGGGGGGGGGGAGGAPLLVPEKVVWEVPAGKTDLVTLDINNVGTSPIKVKIKYSGDIADYIVQPPDGSQVVITPGEFKLVVKVDPKDLPVGKTVTGKILILPTGSSIEVPVEMKIVSPTAEVPKEVTKGILVPVVIVAGLIVAYMLFARGLI